MTVTDDVRALIDRLAPEAICDDCVAERRKDICSMCSGEKPVIRRLK